MICVNASQRLSLIAFGWSGRRTAKPSLSSDMRKHLLVAVGCIISTVASAQEWRAAADKWRSCADAAAVRYSKSAESAPVVARLAALACADDKKKTWEMVSKTDGKSVADDYVDAMERRYIDRLSVDVIEMRLR